MLELFKLQMLIKPVARVLIAVQELDRREIDGDELFETMDTLVSAAEKIGYSRADFSAYLKKLAGEKGN